MRVVFLGSGEIGIPSLRALAASNRHDLCAVFTQPDRPAGRELKLRAPLVKLAALELGIRTFQPERIRASQPVHDLSLLKPDIIVVAAFGQILSKEVFSMPPFGSINIHASLLPRHRGASPIQAAILSGDTETGVTIMQVDAGLDTGDVLLKVVTPITSNETSGSLHDRLAQLAPEALLACLEDFERGRVSPQKQDNAFASYAPKLTRADGEIDWSKPAEEIERRVRAMTPWPGAYTFVASRQLRALLKVHRAELRKGISAPPGTVVAAGDSILVGAGKDGVALNEVQIAGGKRLTAVDFLRGHPIVPGDRLG